MNDFFISLIHYAIGNELPKIQGRYDLSFYLLKLHETLDQLFPELSKMQNGIDLPIYKKIINSIHRYLKI
jgi:hypothetical protein